MSHDVQLSKTQYLSITDEQSEMNRVPYASAIGSIMYAMLCTRPDDSYALSVTSKYQANLSLAVNVYTEAKYIAAFEAPIDSFWIK